MRDPYPPHRVTRIRRPRRKHRIKGGRFSIPNENTSHITTQGGGVIVSSLVVVLPAIFVLVRPRVFEQYLLDGGGCCNGRGVHVGGNLFKHPDRLLVEQCRQSFLDVQREDRRRVVHDLLTVISRARPRRVYQSIPLQDEKAQQHGGAATAAADGGGGSGPGRGQATNTIVRTPAGIGDALCNAG